jgi:hypothetical protein
LPGDASDVAGVGHLDPRVSDPPRALPCSSQAMPSGARIAGDAGARHWRAVVDPRTSCPERPRNGVVLVVRLGSADSSRRRPGSFGEDLGEVVPECLRQVGGDAVPGPRVAEARVVGVVGQRLARLDVGERFGFALQRRAQRRRAGSQAPGRRG